MKSVISIFAIVAVVAFVLFWSNNSGITGSFAGASKARFPEAVWSAMAWGQDSIELPLTKELSQVFFIDYARPVHATPLGSDCGPNSNSFKAMRAKWKSFPVSFSISAEGLSQDVNADGFVDANDAFAAEQSVLNGFAAWDTQDHPVGNLFVPGTPAKIIVSWGFIDGAGGTLAVASTTYNIVTKAIVSVAVTFDSGDSWRVYSILSCSGQGALFDVENVAAHEIGHAVGLDHVRKSGDIALTMYPYASQGETHKRTLGSGDMKGIDALY